MGADSQLDVQKAIWEVLCADQDIVNILAAGAEGIYDHVPKNSVFPYIVLGEVRALPFDSMLAKGMEQVITLRIFSHYKGMKEVKEIMSAIHAALHDADIQIANQNLVLLRLESCETRLDSGGLARQGVMRFRIITEEQE